MRCSDGLRASRAGAARQQQPFCRPHCSSSSSINRAARRASLLRASAAAAGVPSGLIGCKLIGVGSSAPEAVLSNAELEKYVETNDEWIYSRTGIKRRP